MININGQLIIVCGATGSGKSTLVDAVLRYYPNDFVRAKKYSTRKYRGEGDDIIPIKEKDFQKGEFDLAYLAMDKKYGVKFSQIEADLSSGKNSILVLTDFRAVHRLRSAFPDNSIALCIMSSMKPSKFIEIHCQRYGFNPEEKNKHKFHTQFRKLRSAGDLGLWDDVYYCINDLQDIWRENITEKESLEIRTNKVRDFQLKYIENREVFDYTILNYIEYNVENLYRVEEHLIKQFENIFKFNTEKIRNKRNIKQPIMYVVAGASGSGKGYVAEALNIIAPNEIQILKKQGKREPRKGDRDDGMEAIGEQGNFAPEYNLVYTMHADEKKGVKGFQYALSEKKIRENIQKGKSFLAIANVLLDLGFWEKLKKLFGDHIVFIYLLRFEDKNKLETYHRSKIESNHKTEEDIEGEVKVRMNETEKTYMSYIENVTDIDYILLNTAYKEDIVDQMFWLFEHYNTIKRTKSE